MSSSLGSICNRLHFSLHCHSRGRSQCLIAGFRAVNGGGRWLEAMHRPIRKPRIGDVAARAGVSTATVSRTLASPDQVRPKTREAVMKAVRETGYVLNVAARSLRTSRSHAVLAVLPDASNIFFSQVLRGISDTLHQHGYS